MSTELKHTKRVIEMLPRPLANIVGYEISPTVDDGANAWVVETIADAAEAANGSWSLYLRIGTADSNVAFHLRDFPPDDTGFEVAMLILKELLGDVDRLAYLRTWIGRGVRVKVESAWTSGVVKDVVPENYSLVVRCQDGLLINFFANELELLP